MNTTLLLAIVIVCVIAVFGAALVLALPYFGGTAQQARNLVASQRNQGSASTREGIFSPGGKQVKFEEYQNKVADSKLTLQKKLKFAQWKISPIIFRVFEITLSTLAFSFAYAHLNFLFQLLALGVGPLIMNFLVTLFVERRFKAFDADYPQFLLSLVGLLKTGMNPVQGLEAAAKGLDEGSLVRQEVEVMMERLRFGVSEDRSIGSFGEDIFHPEIELFVQALLLSRRVGGTLSDTLDRLAKQVRKRQYFRRSAQAAVGLQRGSIWFIIAILCALEVYLYFAYPEAIVGALQDELGWQVWQAGIAIILLGIYWVRQVTKIRV